VPHESLKLVGRERVAPRRTDDRVAHDQHGHAILAEELLELLAELAAALRRLGKAALRACGVGSVGRVSILPSAFGGYGKPPYGSERRKISRTGGDV